MEVFKKYFPDIDNWEQDEVKVCCPFHTDTNPSASIKTEKSLFHCWVCDVGYNEEQFLAKINNIPVRDAMKLLSDYNTQNLWDVEKARLWSNKVYLDKVKSMGFTERTMEELNLGIVKDENNKNVYLGVPVFYNNILVDVRRYNFMKYDGVRKVMSNDGAKMGFLIPYDTFLKSNEPCYIFEGEKDMIMAREQGINAYTFTGGAGAKPNEYVKNAFKGKNIVMCYDNDDAGRDGMYSIYNCLKDVVKSIKYINIGNLVKENKEDFYDYITKYDGDAIEFLGEEHLEFKPKEEDKVKYTPIRKVLADNIINKYVNSTVTVTSEFANVYSVPTIVEFEKVSETGTKKDTMFLGEKRSWYLEEYKIQQILELVEVDAKTYQRNNKLKEYVDITQIEPGVELKIKEQKTLYKTTVSDTVGAIVDEKGGSSSNGNAVSIDLYSFDKLDVGGQYNIEYKIYPHPTKHQKVIAIAKKCVSLNDNNNYVVNKDNLKLFKVDGTIEDRLNHIFGSTRHHIAKHLNYNMWLFCDLVFNSILDFKYGEVMRGALDVFILGDTQVGKSEASSKLVELYNFGHFLSLKTSTTVGLIGGSSKVEGTYCNTIGSIPRQHKKLAVLEEFSGARYDFIKTMTDIRSSNELRLSRVSGELIVPCKLRMITISNPINDENGNPRGLNTFPNGVMPLMELIKSAEDVARYDGFILIPKVEDRVNPFTIQLKGEPIPKEAYEDKIKWVETRKVENVKFDEGVESYIWEKAEELNHIFECNFPLFGTTSSKKLARFCVALATLIVNVDETYENIIVTKEIVDYMVKYLISIYDNGVFKLKDYADEYKSYSVCDDKDVKCLEGIYARYATMLNFLNGCSRTSRSNLVSISGLEGNKFGPIFNKLIADKFIKLNGDYVYPTNKFRIAFKKIDKNFAIDTGSLVAPLEGSSGVTFDYK